MNSLQQQTPVGESRTLVFEARGARAAQRSRFPLTPGRTFVVGRTPPAEFVVPWEQFLSRRHFEGTLEGGMLRIRVFPEARNPVFHRGRAVTECTLAPGERLVVGETTFALSPSAGTAAESRTDDTPLTELAFSPRELQQARFIDAERQIEVLTQLPELISRARTDAALYERLTELVLAGITSADRVAVVDVAAEPLRMLYSATRRGVQGGERISRRLARDALRRGAPVLHMWHGSVGPAKYTEHAEADWAFCTPLKLDVSPGLVLYVTGRLHDTQDVRALRSRLGPDIRFTGLVAEVVAAVRRATLLERRQSALRQFFSPPVLEVIGDDLDAELLAPRECDLTVMFCDLRGFSHATEESAEQADLAGFLERVSAALTVMASEVFRFHGVTADFLGDAMLAMWGWPLSSAEAPLEACRAALAIRARFKDARRQAGHPLADFRMGIGVAHGRSVAGKIGTPEHVKITAFGPVVNLASRLQELTKVLRVPIVIDEATASLVRERLPRTVARTRLLAKVVPRGMKQPLNVYELLPPQQWEPLFTDEQLEQYERGVRAFIAGDWQTAYELLHTMPVADRAHDVLLMLMARHNRQAPPDWPGYLPLPLDT
ncbi:MAG: adenylate/guanylate cyclase domain-containing protein [Planctomycetota bacterium]|nr:MAG: adenylate/guanylate cyclase domain-containing protein [Planctomycetota bacterium]